MALYAMLLYYPRDRYWDSPEDTQLSAVYDEIKSFAGRPGSCAAAKRCTRCR